MVKHNNTTESGHFRKSWQKKVKTWFDAPAKKSKRRIKRKQNNDNLIGLKFIASPLRPIVHCPTKLHNLKIKFGKGFSRSELKYVGLNSKTASAIGISVDKRKKKVYAKTKDANSFKRLKEFLARTSASENKHNYHKGKLCNYVNPFGYAVVSKMGKAQIVLPNTFLRMQSHSGEKNSCNKNNCIGCADLNVLNKNEMQERNHKNTNSFTFSCAPLPHTTNCIQKNLNFILREK